MFLRRANWAWATGLLTVGVMIVLDALQMRELLADGGFLTWLLGGLVAGGGFVWLVALFRPNSLPSQQKNRIPSIEPSYNAPVAPVSAENSAVDRQMLFDQIRSRLSPDDIYDLIFDTNLNENSVIAPSQDMQETIIRLMDEAGRAGQSGQLAMSVERILTPLSKDSLPRLGRLSAETPSHLLRQTIIANLSFDDLANLCTELDIDWQEMGSDAKKTRVRRLLRYLQRRSRLPELFEQLQSPSVEKTQP